MKLLLCDANYDRKSSDCTNALRPRRFKQYDVSINLYEIVLNAWHFLPAKFFPEYYFYKVSFELPQNVTWTNE